MKFSVLIATVGRKDLVLQAVDSVLRQKTASDIEIVVTDSSPSSEVEEAIRNLSDRRIHYYKTPEGDPSLGWEFAYENSTGDYVIWFDDDNYFLPGAFEMFERLIVETRAEIVTGHHVYYYDQFHPVKHLRGVLKVENPALFDGQIHYLDPKKIARSFLFNKLSGAERKFKYHQIATAVSREVCERARLRQGYVVVPKMRCNHSELFSVFSMAKSVVAVGLPLSVVGRLGISFTQTYHNRKRTWKRPAFSFSLSPIHADVYANHVVESILAARDGLFPKDPDFDLSLEPFLQSVTIQLAGADHPFNFMRKEWREILLVARTGLDKQISWKNYRKIRSLWMLAFILQPLKSLRLWSMFGRFVFIKESFRKTIRFTFFRNIERLLKRFRSRRSLSEGLNIKLAAYGVRTMGEAAKEFSGLFEKEVGVNISCMAPSFAMASEDGNGVKLSKPAEENGRSNNEGGDVKENWSIKNVSLIERSGKAVSLISRYFKSGKSREILVLGSGQGFFIQHLPDRGLIISASDRQNFLRPASLSKVKSFKQANLNGSLPFADASFDAVAAWQVLEHVEYPANFFAEARRVLKKDGLLFFSIPNFLNLKNRLFFLFKGEMHRYSDLNSHISVFTKTTLRKLYSRGFEVERIGFHGFEFIWQLPKGLRFLKFFLRRFDLFRHTMFVVLRKK